MKFYLTLFSLIILISSCDFSRNITRPSELLKKIYKYDKSKKYEKIKDLIFNINFVESGKVYKSSEMIVDGIIKRKKFNQFAYSEKGILKHINYVDDNCIRGDSNDIDIYLIKSKIADNSTELMKIIKEKPENIIFYKVAYTVLGFVATENGLKLLMSTNLADTDFTDEDLKR
ncbi:MAG TPA: hypothetical protein PLG34_07830 [Spirochaetota bacterium]|jgi:hypothetical protein|nr:MAG: hypothetical protein BWX91_01938 [Spirochaetes bacterium ADurb.Bin133]HNZ26136.1 hypothetical protein [Spirochaetota bacterium]HPY87877.1 hypothetical protein [Spirochaetota bacterium]HQB60213.1 hypothetical protein [Spirochaetota bacterium]